MMIFTFIGLRANAILAPKPFDTAAARTALCAAGKDLLAQRWSYTFPLGHET